MELLFLLVLLAGAAISVIGSLLWWFGIIWAAKRAGFAGRRSPQLPGRVGQFNRAMRDLDAIGQARLDIGEAERTSLAASAGIDLSR